MVWFSLFEEKTKPNRTIPILKGGKTKKEKKTLIKEGKKINKNQKD